MYKTKKENSLKVGDTFWAVFYNSDGEKEMAECTLTDIVSTKCHGDIYVSDVRLKDGRVIIGNDKPSSVGKTIFKNQEDALKALEDRKGI